MPSDRKPVYQLKIKLQSVYTELERAVEQVSDFMDECTDDDDLAHRVVLAISEAISNGMEHGNAGEQSKHVHVSLRAFEDEMIASVEDEGGGFDPDEIENPLLEENLFRESGRGLYIIESVCDSVSYKKGGRMVRMEFTGDIRCD